MKDAANSKIKEKEAAEKKAKEDEANKEKREREEAREKERRDTLKAEAMEDDERLVNEELERANAAEAKKQSIAGLMDVIAKEWGKPRSELN